MNWSPQQDAALVAVKRWLRERSAPFFYLAGYAGTGKTTLAKHFAQDVEGEVVYGSFTGKAASVMRSKGCHEATTIHRLIYSSHEKGTARLRELQDALDEASTEVQRIALRTKIREELERIRQPHFQLNEASAVKDAALVIIDECSMVGEQMGRDLLSFDVPVLVLGDPAQLPPVGSAGYFTKGEPDVMLTEVHRQAAESGILQIATGIRQGKELRLCRLNDAQVIRKADLEPDSVPGFDQVLVGLNKTRFATNVRMRDLLGRTSDMPQAGDKLVCLRNNHDRALLNGEMYEAVDDAHDIDSYKMQLVIRPHEGALSQSVEAWKDPFAGNDIADHSRSVDEFDYGYVITTHKAQGSQWPRVLVFDQSRYFRDKARKWLYTAVTRASDELVVVR